ncbi:PREDICTED: uncharacterized protein LOC107102335 [Cyprinodon variegatus]|uniref:uncharacterized protein LOC107102335 n=1 Tax=Cyprinodon variegatus TaxID=28743 RepID=UPI000742A343|nr:PREDICTED: uncharacterized protein LOC107102335 [Cyprinodon variegatus]
MPHEYPPVFPVELLVHTLSRTRILVLDHVEQSFKDLPGLVEAMVKERKESVRLEQELQLKSEYIRTHIYEPRLAELQLHQQHVDDHCQDMLHILASCKEEFQGLQKSLQEENLEFLKVLNSHSRELQELKASIQKDAQDGLHMALTSCNRLDAFGSTLRSCLEQHAADIQSRKENFRLSIQSRMEEVRRRTSHLLKSFRKFHEGRSFAPREVEKLQGSLQKKTRQISAAEQKIYKKLMVFEPESSDQVRKASTSLEDEFSSLQTEVKFNVKIQEIISRTQIKIRAEEAKSNQLQSELMNNLKELRRMMKKNPVSPEQICSFISSTNEGIKKHCLYLGFDLSGTLSPESRQPVQSGSLKLSGMDLDLPAAVRSVERLIVRAESQNVDE